MDRLDWALRSRVSGFDGRYRALVGAGLRFVDLKGLATVGPFTPELDEVFVDVSLAFRPPHLVPAGLLADLPAGDMERHALGEFLDSPEPVVLAVVGAPGSGKTTLLRYTARQACLYRRGRRGGARRLPILLYLRDHVPAIVADPDVALADLLRSTLGGLRAAEPQGWFEQRLRAGECVVLLDGLDEVARQEDRTKVATWTERQVSQYPRNDYVITSRPQGYRTAGISGAAVLQVRGRQPVRQKKTLAAEEATGICWVLAAPKHPQAGVSLLHIGAYGVARAWQAGQFKITKRARRHAV